MPRFIIVWDAGFGQSAEIVDVDSKAEAEKIAYDRWHEEAQSEAHYSAEEYTDELADDLDLVSGEE